MFVLIFVRYAYVHSEVNTQSFRVLKQVLSLLTIVFEVLINYVPI
jgi:hypothetical protein